MQLRPLSVLCCIRVASLCPSFLPWPHLSPLLFPFLLYAHMIDYIMIGAAHKTGFTLEVIYEHLEVDDSWQ